MGLMDRFRSVDEELSEEPPDYEPEYDYLPEAPGSPVAEAIVDILRSFLNPEDHFSGMLFSVARRYLADADTAQLYAVVANLCESADRLGPLVTPPIVRPAPVGPVVVGAGPGDGGGGPDGPADPAPATPGRALAVVPDPG